MPASGSNIEQHFRRGIAFPMDFRGNRGSIFDTIEEKRIWRTLDAHLLPIASLLYPSFEQATRG
jgi:hypothetical protein